ncbi:MAG TPA: hypothetical protein PKM63_19755 [Panacibacter sp.]|nr:hypothetical protein [Panacibacter sp.]HNP46541.1 hypothetical protein [Panacibacter sp.]
MCTTRSSIYRSGFAAALKKGCIRLVDWLFPFVGRQHFDLAWFTIANEALLGIRIRSTQETMDALEQHIRCMQTGAYMRFGDGDVYLLKNKSEAYQEANDRLAAEMKEAFLLSDDGVMKALAIHSERFGHEPGMHPGHHLVPDGPAADLARSVYPWFTGLPVFSPVALHYTATAFPERANRFLKLLKAHALLFIGNESVPAEKLMQLFGAVPHIKTPSRNAYYAMDRIEQETVLQLEQLSRPFGVLVVAMGCSGRVLMKRLYHRGYPVFLFDFGSLLDGICGWETRTWLKGEIRYDVLLEGL